MALTIKRPKQDEEVDELPKDEEIEAVDSEEGEEVESVDELTRLKLENAEQRGRLSVLQSTPKAPVADPRSALQNTKAIVFADANNLSDEDFVDKYKMQKHMATASVLEQENRLTAQETKRLNAEARAEAELSARFGSDFYRFKGRIEESLEDLSEEARQDPKRLVKHMERQLKGLVTAKPKKEEISARSKVVSDFEVPQPAAGNKPAEQRAKKADEIAEEDRSLARAMGLTSESERLMYTQDVIPMDMGGGVVFRDASKGFEKVEAAVAK